MPLRTMLVTGFTGLALLASPRRCWRRPCPAHQVSRGHRPADRALRRGPRRAHPARRRPGRRSAGGPRTATRPRSPRSARRTSSPTRPSWRPRRPPRGGPRAGGRPPARGAPRAPHAARPRHRAGAPVDLLLGDLDLAAHVDDDLFATKVAFLALLNFPVHTLAERLADGPAWDRDDLGALPDDGPLRRRACRPRSRQEITRALTAADQYIAGYNIRMDRLVDAHGSRPVPRRPAPDHPLGAARRARSPSYGEPGGSSEQRLIAAGHGAHRPPGDPAAVIDNPALSGAPTATRSGRWRRRGRAGRRRASASPTRRYATILDVFHAVRAVDPYSPTAPTFIARTFELDRQMPESAGRGAARLGARLARGQGPRRADRAPPRPPARAVRHLVHRLQARAATDARPSSTASSPRATRPSRRSRRDLPRILTGARLHAGEGRAGSPTRIVVDPSRGAGHAMGAVRREDKAHLRTRIPAGRHGLQGLQHRRSTSWATTSSRCSRSTASTTGSLAGVPNNAFTEALAFVFQSRDLELLGLARPATRRADAEALDDLWATYEIGGVSLVDMRVWRWMYAHPDATPAQLREATLASPATSGTATTRRSSA